MTQILATLNQSALVLLLPPLLFWSDDGTLGAGQDVLNMNISSLIRESRARQDPLDFVRQNEILLSRSVKQVKSRRQIFIRHILWRDGHLKSFIVDLQSSKRSFFPLFFHLR